MVLLCSAAWHGVCFVRVLAHVRMLAHVRVCAHAGVFVAMHCHVV
jgi:hypothetical protein